jgi:mannose-6-phosphate isomerase-like protein (cupin superfamily)
MGDRSLEVVAAGALGAPQIIGAGERERLNVFGVGVTVLLTAAETGGAYSTYYVDCPPGVGTPLHVHQRDDESFFVIEGTVTFRVGAETVAAGPGATVFLPRGVPHQFVNLSDAPIRMLGTGTPSGHERFFQEAARLVPGPDGRPDPAEATAVCVRNGMEILGM